MSLKGIAQTVGDRADCFIGHPFTVVGFILSIPAIYFLLGPDAANLYISIVTALVLFVTAGTNRTDVKAEHKKLDAVVPEKLRGAETKTEAEIQEL